MDLTMTLLLRRIETQGGLDVAAEGSRKGLRQSTADSLPILEEANVCPISAIQQTRIIGESPRNPHETRRKRASMLCSCSLLCFTGDTFGRQLLAFRRPKKTPVSFANRAITVEHVRSFARCRRRNLLMCCRRFPLLTLR